MFDKTSLYLENYKKDLNRVYEETYDKVVQWQNSLEMPFEEALHHEDYPETTKVIIRDTMSFWEKLPRLLGTSATLYYIPIIHLILFTDLWKQNELNRLYDFLGRPLLSAEEIYESSIRINPDVIDKLLASLSPCSLADIEHLKSDYHNREKGAFVKRISELTCDLTNINLTCSLVLLVSQLLDMIIGRPLQFYDFVYYSDTNLSRGIRENANLSREDCVEPYLDAPEKADSDNTTIETAENTLLGIKEVALAALGAAVGFYQQFKQNGGEFFDFEEDYLAKILEDPEVKEFIEQQMQQESLDEPSEENTQEEIDKQRLPRPADDVLRGDPNAQLRKNWFELPFDYDNLKNYYQDTTIKSRNTISFEEIESIYSFLVAQKKVKNDNDMLLLFAYRISGRKISGVKTGEVIEWQDVKEDPHLPYIIYSLVKDTQIPKKTSCFFVAQGKLSLNPSDLRTSYRSFMNGKKYEKNPFKKAFEKCFKDTFGEELIYSDVR